MAEVIVNSEQSLASAIGELRELFKTRKYFSFVPKFGKRRSVDQNAMSHAWYQQVADELREDDALGVKCFCKLHFAVPILHAEDEDFRQAYNATILRSFTYEQKLELMKIFPVTSLMTTVQLKKYTDAVQDHYAGRNVKLEYPPDEDGRTFHQQ